VKGKQVMRDEGKRNELDARGAGNWTAIAIRVTLGSLLVACAEVPAVAQLPPALEARIEATVREVGSLETVRATEIHCEVKGQATLISIVPEGTQVKQGDLLVEFDDSKLQDRLAASKIALESAAAAVVAAKQDLEQAQQQGSLNLTIARQALALVAVEQERVLGKNGTLALELLEVQSALEVARLRLMAAEKRLVGMDESDVHYAELQLVMKEAQAAIRLGDARQQLLTGVETRKRKLQSQLALAEAEQEVKSRAAEQLGLVRSAEANLRATSAAEQVQKKQVADIEEQIKRCKIHAPQAGTVMHVRAMNGRTGRQALAAGSTVRERQPLLRLPDLSEWQMRVSVNESRIARVRVGAPARVSLDAIPGEVFQGKVKRVSATPEPAMWFEADVQRYAVTVSLDQQPEFARFGLTGEVEIRLPKR